MRHLLVLLLVVLSVACRRDKPETGTAASASPYTSESDTSAREDGLEGTVSGTELQAPRLIPAMRNQLELMRAGSQVNEDTDVCMIEAMKTYNAIKADCRGTIAKILVQDGQPVEYGTVLFLVKPS